MTGDAVGDRARLAELITELAVVRGRVVLSSGAVTDWYVDLRRITLHHEAAPLVGRLMCELTADWDFTVVGGLTLGADPLATAMLHAGVARGDRLDACVVRKQGKAHGLQRRVEGPEVEGRSVLAVDDTSTTGASVLAAVEALREAGAEVIGIALIIDRGAGPALTSTGLPYRALFS
ncbi:MAG: orotate phosphoribosyltransferase, partial [Geodermatophilaceae bacterium]|nr:orotate phosphoribosyltransferase [Geodermatophilaceae bacterium]